jgi:hypothetical protein
MHDLMTLLAIRDELQKQKEFAKSNARHQWSGLQAAMNIVQRAIQLEVDDRNNQQEAV